MRVAICLYGLVGGKDGKDGSGEDIPFKKCYDRYKKHIFDINETDVFIHSWSQHLEDDIVDLYKPKLYQFQKQKMFEKEIDMPARITKVPPENRKSYRTGRNNWRNFSSDASQALARLTRAHH